MLLFTFVACDQRDVFIGLQDCVKPECVDVSAYIMRKMNHSADPCVDFYSYSCGGWESTTFIPPEYAKYDTFAEVRTNNEVILKRVSFLGSCRVLTGFEFPMAFFMCGEKKMWRNMGSQGLEKVQNGYNFFLLHF